MCQKLIPPSPSVKIYDPVLSIDALVEYFSKFGTVEKIKFIDTSKTGKNYAFLLMEDKSVVERIMGN